MSSYTGISPKNPSKYLGPNVYICSIVSRDREPSGADYRQPETGKLYPIGSYWIIAKNPTSGAEGDLWYLSKIVANVAYWVKFTSGGGGGNVNSVQVDAFTSPGTNPVLPNGSGIIIATGAQVAAGTTSSVIRTDSLAANTFTIEIQRSSAQGSSTIGANGVSHFNSSQFSVDSNGYVSFTGGMGTNESFAMQTGVSPVVPDGSSIVTFNGEAVAAGTNPVITNGTGANTMTLQVQTSQAIASSDATKIGLANFNSAQFSVDSNGFVSLSGGGIAIDSVAVDTSSGAGTNPVTPNGSGLITVTGAQVASGTIGANAIRTNSLAANTYTIQIQRAAGASSSSVNNNGIASFNSSDFSVDSNGYVSLNPITSTDFANLGISYSAGTFTVTGYNGTALSASNPAVIWLQNKSVPGRLIKYIVTSNQTFTDGAAGTIDNMLWGLTTGVNASVDIPFFLYAVGNDSQNAIAFMISRVPHATNSPASTSIGQSGAVVNVGQGDFFSLASITTTVYDLNPCVLLGSFRMQFVGATDSWTVQTLTTTDGIDIFQEGKNFTMPRGQFGAAAGKWFLNNGGTAPDDSGGTYYYNITTSGKVIVDFSFGSVTTAGVGGNQTLLAAPFVRTAGISSGAGYWVGAGGSPGSVMAINLVETTNSFTSVINAYSGGLGALITTNVLNSDMGLSAVYRMSSIYPASL